MTILAIDCGTTSARALVFTADGRTVAMASRPLPMAYPHAGWVEQDAEDWWRATRATCREAVARAGKAPLAIGITNQRETVVVWDRVTGRPIAPAIVWQDRRTAEVCARLRGDGLEALVQERTGLLIDPYFSATKIAWILDHTPGARVAAQRGDLACGTVDTFLVWRMTDGRVHATDATNASRTSLYDPARHDWDDDLLRAFAVPRALMPEVRDSSDDFGIADALATDVGRALPIASLCGDQQAALIGQACVRPGMAKSTYGTGCFMLANAGETMPRSRHRLLGTVAYRIAGRTTYALEGSIFNAGSTIQWLRDGLKVIADAGDSARLAQSLPDNGGVHLVPAFTGLGAPHWDADARATISGLTRDSGPAHLARAALEAVCYQTRELIDAFAADGAPVAALRIDGGMAANDWLAQFLADVCAVPVARPREFECTAWGAAWLAGMRVGVLPGLDQADALWRAARTFVPASDERHRSTLMDAWRTAVARARLH